MPGYVWPIVYLHAWGLLLSLSLSPPYKYYIFDLISTQTKQFPHSLSTSMAIPKLLLASIFLALLVVHDGGQAAQTNQVTSNSASEAANTPKIDCGSACAARCKLSSRPNLCKRACGTCCARCSCVPPGTYGHYEACPCYATLTTRGNKRKCP